MKINIEVGDIESDTWILKSDKLVLNGIQIQEIPICDVVKFDKREVVGKKYYADFELGTAQKFTASMDQKVYAAIYDLFLKKGNNPIHAELPLKRKSIKNLMLAGFALLLVLGWINEGINGSSTSHVNKQNPSPCNFLSDINLATRAWNEQQRTCSSNYLEIDPDRVGGSGLPNNIAYYYQHGKALIVLNMNNPNNIVNPFAKFKEAASSLSLKATGVELPMEMKKAIYKHSQMPVGMDNEKYMWRLKRVDWDNGNGGYELQFAIIGNMLD